MLGITKLGKAGSKDSKGKSPIDYYLSVEFKNDVEEKIKALDGSPLTQALADQLDALGYRRGEVGEPINASQELGYYVGGSATSVECQPVWSGKSAAKLGLVGKIQGGGLVDVEMLAKGYDRLGNALVRGAGDGHRVGYDMTFSANKYVSALFAAADDNLKRGIQEDMAASVHAAIAFMEKSALTRLGEDGHRHEAVKGVAAALFPHFASRENDPQLHIHALIFNVAERQDGTFGTLDSKGFFDMKMAVGALWRADLAERLAKRGLGIEKEGRDNFKISGISSQTVETLSTRRQQIVAELSRKGASGPLASQKAAMATRKKKAEPPLEKLLVEWRDQCKAMGLDDKAIEEMIAGEAGRPREPFVLDQEKILRQLTEQHSTFGPHDVIKAVAIEAVGHWGIERCEAEAESIMAGENVLHLGKSGHEKAPPKFTTLARFELEKAIGLSAERRKDETAHRVDADSIAAGIAEQEKIQGFSLNKEQRDSVRWICGETGGMACVEGWAGTGKTTMLNTVNKVLTDAGFQTLGTSLGGNAAENLQQETGIPSQTLASLLMELDGGRRKLGERNIIVIDEAGMVGSTMFRRLQEHADVAGAKLCLVGDPKQLQAIEAGGIMKSLMKTVGKAELSDIQRQKTDLKSLRGILNGRDDRGNRVMTKARRVEMTKVEDKGLDAWARGLATIDPDVAEALAAWRGRSDFQWMRDEVKNFATGDESSGRGHAAKAIRELDRRGLITIADSTTEACERMVVDWMATGGLLKNKIMLAATNEELFKINVLAREALAAKGALDLAEGTESMRFHLGGKSYRDFVAGDRVVFTKNDKRLRVKNGYMGTVEGFGQEKGREVMRVRVDSDSGPGKVISVDPESYRNMDYSYAVSGHKAQGMTRDFAFVMVNSSMADREWSYVAFSRARFATKGYAIEGDVSHLLDANHHKLDKAQQTAIERDKQLELMGLHMGKSRAKDTTLDYDKAMTGAEAVAEKAAREAQLRPILAAGGGKPKSKSKPMAAGAVAEHEAGQQKQLEREALDAAKRMAGKGGRTR